MVCDDLVLTEDGLGVLLFEQLGVEIAEYSAY